MYIHLQYNSRNSLKKVNASSFSMKTKFNFAQLLIQWSIENPRTLPWIAEKNPYKVWVSEIMLQQTRVETVLPYFEKFIKAFPTIQTLAVATESQIFKRWEGLGYYSRARNMHFTAKYIVNDLNGNFPNNRAALLKLKGIGRYTSAAIASFCYDENVAALDGNGIRILSRVFGIAENPWTLSGVTYFEKQAAAILPKNQAALFNQALMDFGSKICLPKNPHCQDCPFSFACKAYREDRIAEFPIKKTKIELRKRHFHYFVIQDQKNNFWIHKRVENDIWKGLHEFYLIETTKKNLSKRVVQQIFGKLNSALNPEIILNFSQKLSHQHIFTYFYAVKPIEKAVQADFFLVKQENLKKFAFPKSILVFLENFIRL